MRFKSFFCLLLLSERFVVMKISHFRLSSDDNAKCRGSSLCVARLACCGDSLSRGPPYSELGDGNDEVAFLSVVNDHSLLRRKTQHKKRSRVDEMRFFRVETAIP